MTTVPAADPFVEPAVLDKVPLRYVARTGLLPELSAQTYDQFYKALRESVLNSMDALATRVEIDFGDVASGGRLSVMDDGNGMSPEDFLEGFMSLGGSNKFGNEAMFGRIGIGSLALLQYGSAAVVESKVQDSTEWFRASISHPWEMSVVERRATLEEMPVGSLVAMRYDGDPEDHFTRVTVTGLRDDARRFGADPGDFFMLLERLRRILPLVWRDVPLARAVKRADAKVEADIETHTRRCTAEIVLHSPWQRGIALDKRTFGDAGAANEEWIGSPGVLDKTLRLPEGRLIRIVGYLVSLARTNSAWSGLAARVQNVVIEEGTFFDLRGDPGFLKYIAGEVFIFGDVDRSRLINIDRSSFNRECIDYREIQRYVSSEILAFKSTAVQQPQRARVDVKRRVERDRKAVAAAQSVCNRWSACFGSGRRLPSSHLQMPRRYVSERLVDSLDQMGMKVEVDDDATDCTVSVFEEGDMVVVVPGDLANPSVFVGRRSYGVRFIRGNGRGLPVWIRNRPMELVFDVAHPAIDGDAHRCETVLALELSWLASSLDESVEIQRAMLELISRSPP